ncbi:MAG: hypothetical protein R6W88_05875 [Desulfobacterales bacterium]
MKDHMLILALAFVLWTWINLYLRRTKRQIIIQKEMKTLALKRFEGKIKSDEKQILRTMALRMAGGYSRIFVEPGMDAYRCLNEKSSRIEDETLKPEGKLHGIRPTLIQKNMNIDFLRIKVKRAEFKMTAIRNLKLLVFGLIFLWSCLTFYDLLKDFSLKGNVEQFRWVMFNVNINLSVGIFA